MYIEPGNFKLNKEPDDDVILDGHYDIKEIQHEVYPFPDEDRNINCQEIFRKGNVLYKTETENLDDLIKIFIRYTHDPCNDIRSEFDFSISSLHQMRGGTICPTKKVLFAYKGKVFVAYGRYIYGYDETYVKFKRKFDNYVNNEDGDDTDSSEGVEDDNSVCEPYDYTIRESMLSHNKIILAEPKFEPELCEYVYSFKIYDLNSGILDAFGLYR